MIYTYIYTYILMKILYRRIIHICFHNIIAIYILIKKNVYNTLFFAHNYRNHIVQSFEG